MEVVCVFAFRTKVKSLQVYANHKNKISAWLVIYGSFLEPPGFDVRATDHMPFQQTIQSVKLQIKQAISDEFARPPESGLAKIFMWRHVSVRGCNPCRCSTALLA